MDERAQLAFAEIIGDGDQTVLLLEHPGVVTAGMYMDSFGRDVSVEIGAALGAIGAEAGNAMRHLPLGSWRAIACECTEANLVIGPVGDSGVIIVAAAPSVPMGYARRLLDHAASRALKWQEEVA